MNYIDYKTLDVLNGEGIRNSLFVSGCTHKCKGCFNAKAWSFTSGKEFTEEMTNKIIVDLKSTTRPVRGISILGGEPMENEKDLIALLHTIKTTCKDKDIWLWSGYTYEEIMKDTLKRELLSYVDVLVDGKFDIDKKDIRLKFRGSSNQRIINVKQSLIQNKVVFLYDEDVKLFENIKTNKLKNIFKYLNFKNWFNK